MALLNVRLDADDARRVADLRKGGVQISRPVREAIRAEHEQLGRRRGAARDAATLLARIYADHPDTPDVRPRPHDLRDRSTVRRAIVERSQKKRV